MLPELPSRRHLGVLLYMHFHIHIHLDIYSWEVVVWRCHRESPVDLTLLVPTAGSTDSNPRVCGTAEPEPCYWMGYVSIYSWQVHNGLPSVQYHINWTSQRQDWNYPSHFSECFQIHLKIIAAVAMCFKEHITGAFVDSTTKTSDCVCDTHLGFCEMIVLW